MSGEKACLRPLVTSADAELIMEAWISDGGLDLNKVHTIEPISIEKQNHFYSFMSSEGFSVGARLYWVLEDDQPRQFIWIEVCIGEMKSESPKMMRQLLDRSREIPAAFKFGLSDDLIVLCLRSPVDGFTFDNLRDLVQGIIPCADRLYQELRSNFGLPTWLEIKKAEERAKAH